MQGSITLYQLIDDNYAVKVPDAGTGSRGAAYAHEQYVTGRFLDWFACWLQSLHRKTPAHHTKQPRLVDRGVIPGCLSEAILGVHDSANQRRVARPHP